MAYSTEHSVLRLCERELDLLLVVQPDKAQERRAPHAQHRAVPVAATHLRSAYSSQVAAPAAERAKGRRARGGSHPVGEAFVTAWDVRPSAVCTRGMRSACLVQQRVATFIPLLVALRIRQDPLLQAAVPVVASAARCLAAVAWLDSLL